MNSTRNEAVALLQEAELLIEQYQRPIPLDHVITMRTDLERIHEKFDRIDGSILRSPLWG